MSPKLFLLCACACLIVGCKNEPYLDAPLGVISFLNHETKITGTYKYKEQRISTYTSSDATGKVLLSMRFVYERDQLSRIVSDSVLNDYKYTLFYRPNTTTVIDSSFRFVSGVKSFLGTRTVSLDAEQNPVTVTQRTVIATGFEERSVELLWDGGNVTELIVYDGIATGRQRLSKATLSYDNQNCVYTKNTDYLYTLPIGELYWLSKNNPNVFNYGDKDKKYTYWYNKMGYPSNFKSDTDVLFGVAYTQIR